MDGFAGTAFQSGYNAWVYVDLCHTERSSKILFGFYKETGSAEGADGGDSSFNAAETLLPQNPMPNQFPKKKMQRESVVCCISLIVIFFCSILTVWHTDFLFVISEFCVNLDVL